MRGMNSHNMSAKLMGTPPGFAKTFMKYYNNFLISRENGKGRKSYDEEGVAPLLRLIGRVRWR